MKEVLRATDDATIFALVAVIIFTVFFALLFLRVLKMRKEHANEMASMPLQDTVPVRERVSPSNKQ